MHARHSLYFYSAPNLLRNLLFVCINFSMLYFFLFAQKTTFHCFHPQIPQRSDDAEESAFARAVRCETNAKPETHWSYGSHRSWSGAERKKENLKSKFTLPPVARTSASPLFAGGRNPKVRKLNKMISIQLHIASVQVTALLPARTRVLIPFFAETARGIESFPPFSLPLPPRVVAARFSNFIRSLAGKDNKITDCDIWDDNGERNS